MQILQGSVMTDLILIIIAFYSMLCTIVKNNKNCYHNGLNGMTSEKGSECMVRTHISVMFHVHFLSVETELQCLLLEQFPLPCY